MLNSKFAKATSLQITEGLTVTVYPNTDHGFLISTPQLAKAYGRTVIKVYDARNRAIKKGNLFIGKHYLTSEMIEIKGLNVDDKSIFWTMKGFFDIGKYFKNGNLVEIERMEVSYTSRLIELNRQFIASPQDTMTLTMDNVNSLLLEINKISNKELRMSIANLLLGGR